MDESEKFKRLYWSVQHKIREQEEHYQSIIRGLKRQIITYKSFQSENKKIKQQKRQLCKNIGSFMNTFKKEKFKLQDEINELKQKINELQKKIDYYEKKE